MFRYSLRLDCYGQCIITRGAEVGKNNKPLKDTRQTKAAHFDIMN